VVDNARLDWRAAVARKRGVVNMLRDGAAYQMSERGVTVMHGDAFLVDRRTVQVEQTRLTCDALIIATGSTPRKPNIDGVDQPHVITTSELLDLEILPPQVTILGAEPIALVVASLLALAGVPVDMVSEQAALLPDIDADIVNTLKLELKGVRLHLQSQVTRIEREQVVCADATIPSRLVVAVAGRTPNVRGLGLERLGIDYSDDGVLVDAQGRTNVPNVYAVGDVTGKTMWAHHAIRAGEIAANTILGVRDQRRDALMPTVIYTYPEIAVVGLTENAAQAQGYAVTTARLPFNANGRFLTDNDGKRGLCKVVLDARTERLLGVHMISPNASEAISTAVTMLADEFRAVDVSQLPFAHPTMSEVLKDAVLNM